MFFLMFIDELDFFVSNIKMSINSGFIVGINTWNRETLQYTNIVEISPSTQIIYKYIQRVFKNNFNTVCVVQTRTLYEYN